MKTEKDVAEWIAEMDDNYSPSDEEIEEAFLIVYGRKPEADEDAFSLLCAGVDHEEVA